MPAHGEAIFIYLGTLTLSNKLASLSITDFGKVFKNKKKR